MIKLFQRLTNYFFNEKVYHEKDIDPFSFCIPEGFRDNPDIYLLIFQSNLVKARIKRIRSSIPHEFHNISLYQSLISQESKLEDYLNVKFGESYVLFTNKGEDISRFVSKDEYLSQLQCQLDHVDELLRATEVSISILKQSSFEFYNEKWDELSRELKIAVHSSGILPQQLKKVNHLQLEMTQRLNSFHGGIFRGIKAFENLKSLEIKGKIEREEDFNMLGQLSNLKSISLNEGPKIKWPNESLNISEGFELEDITVKNAQKPEAYQFIFHLEKVKKIRLLNFNKLNIYHILDFLIYKELDEINIHFSEKIEGMNGVILEDIIRPYCGDVKINFYQPAEGEIEALFRA